MSQSHIRIPKQPPPSQPSIWWSLVVSFVLVLLAVGVVFVTSNWIHSFPHHYDRATGKVLETRKTIDAIHESRFGSRVFYRLEVHVQYLAYGQMQDRWIRISD